MSFTYKTNFDQKKKVKNYKRHAWQAVIMSRNVIGRYFRPT